MKSLAAVISLALVLTLISAPAAAEQETAEDCRVEAGSSIGIVLLIDQSSSLNSASNRKLGMLPSIGEAIRKVGSRLQLAAQDDGVDVKLGVVTFGEKATTIRPLSSYALGDSVDGIADELSDVDGLEGSTDYIAGLEAATRMFDSQTDVSCRILLWFTDGFFDLPPDDNPNVSVAKRQQEADLLSDAVCGTGELASRLSSRSVQTFAVLLKPGTPDKWEQWFRGPDSNRYPELHAGLSAMQAITGDGEISALPISDYSPLQECINEIQDSASLGGEVLVGSQQLPGVLFTLLSGAIGGDDLIKCPTSVTAGDVVTVPEGSDGLPAGVMFSRLFVTALEGEIGSVNAVNFPGSPRPLFPSEETNLIDRDQIKDLPAGWKLEISSAGSQDLAVCVQADDPALAGGTDVPVISSVNKVIFGDDDQIELSVDWGEAFEGADPDGVIGRWTVESEFLDVNEWADGASGSVTVTVDERPDEKLIETVRLIVEPKGATQGSETEFGGELVEPIVIQDDAAAPRFECDLEGFGDELYGGVSIEVSDDLYQSPGECTVYPSLEPDTGFVEISVRESGSLDQDMGWKLVDSNGDVLDSTFTVHVGDPAVKMRFATTEPLDNKNWSGSGTLSVTATWSTKPAFTITESFDYTVDLKARSDTGKAALYTIIIAAIAALLSLALLRLLNFLLVKIPSPSAFYVREIPIRISPNATRGASWTPIGDGMQSDSFPVKSTSPGRNLVAGQLQIRRSLGPVWKPFAMPTSRLDGFNVLRSIPAARGRHSAPVGFTHLTVVGTDGGHNPDGSLDATVTSLYPRRLEFDENQVRIEVDRVVESIAGSAEENNGPSPEVSRRDEGGGELPSKPDNAGPPDEGSGPSSRGGPPTRGTGPTGSAPSRPGSGAEPATSRPNPSGERPSPPPRREPPPRRR